MIDLLSPGPLILLFLVTEGFLQAMKHFSRCLELVDALNICSEVADKFPAALLASSGCGISDRAQMSLA
jgi:hypothetical protein